jgi:ankyrin repeat protein
MLASSQGKASAVTTLLKLKSDIDARNKAGETALMLAASLGDTKTVQVLIDHGANAALRNKMKKRAEDMAEAAGHDTVATQIQVYRKQKWLGVF